jgi:hypothetical protein
MDAGTNALPLLEGKAFKLKHGYFGVKCRSQKDINEGVSISDAIKNEVKYFSEHPDYCKHQDTLGFAHLKKSLNRILVGHI